MVISRPARGALCVIFWLVTILHHMVLLKLLPVFIILRAF